MKYKQYKNRVIIRIDKGEEIVNSVKQICKELDIQTGTITGIGATNKVTIGYLNTKTKKYHSQELIGDHEIAPLLGNISTMNGEIYLHFHVNLCNAEQKSYGGHLTSAVVSATFEGVIDIIEGKVEREYDTDIGLNLIKI